MSEPDASRRELLRRGALAAGAVAASGLIRPVAAIAQSPGDEDLRDFLVEAIALEQNLVLAYSTAADAAGGGDAATYTKFRDQEQAHANALLSALDELGFDPPEAPGSPSDTGVFDGVDGLSDDAVKRLTDQLDQIGAAKSDEQFLDLLGSMEEGQLTYYVSEGPGLDAADLSTTAAEIAGCQAQHLVVIGSLAKHPPARSAASVSATAAQAARDASAS